MNRETTKTRSEQRIEQLINCGRPLTDDESDELYRALHADYMRKWRQARADADARREEAARRTHDIMRSEMRRNDGLLEVVRREREQGLRQMFKADAQ